MRQPIRTYDLARSTATTDKQTGTPQGSKGRMNRRWAQDLKGLTHGMRCYTNRWMKMVSGKTGPEKT